MLFLSMLIYERATHASFVIFKLTQQDDATPPLPTPPPTEIPSFAPLHDDLFTYESPCVGETSIAGLSEVLVTSAGGTTQFWWKSR